MSKRCPDRFIPERVVDVWDQYDRDLEWEEAIHKMISESNHVSALNNSPKTHHVRVSPTTSPPGMFEKPVLSSAEKEQQRREEERIKKGNIR